MYIIANRRIKDYPKNSKEGILLSKFEDNTDGVLIDVRMTKDGKLVLYENDLIFNDYYISKMNYQDIQKIKIGNSLNNYHIPLLEDILMYYEKDILIINLHHNYDQNERLVQELKRILEKYYIKKIIIVADNNHLLEYLNLLTDYEVYHLNDNSKFINVDIKIENYNNTIRSSIVTNNKNDYARFYKLKDIQDNLDNFFVITNNPNLLKRYYL